LDQGYQAANQKIQLSLVPQAAIGSICLSIPAK
jgi:hypothetical protein